MEVSHPGCFLVYFYLEFQILSKNSLRLGVKELAHGTYFKLWILNLNINLKYELTLLKFELIMNECSLFVVQKSLKELN